MFLTITTTYRPATDIGYILHKNPKNLHKKSLPFGDVYVFYPEATEERCTVGVLLDIDPIGLTRKDSKRHTFALEPYVNDRPYVASSFLSVALKRIFSTLFSGNSKQRQELIDTPMPLEVAIYSLPCRGGEKILRQLFEPLGYELDITHHILDEKFPEWGESPYFSVKLRKKCLLREFLIHLYVIIPVLDNEKHYWIGDDEVGKLLKFGEGWLAKHPAKEFITRRYLKNFGSLVDLANAQLTDEDENLFQVSEKAIEQEEMLEQKINLNEQRQSHVVNMLKKYHAVKVIDLGCGEGKLIKELLKDHSFQKISGCDVSSRTLERAHQHLNIDNLSSLQQQRIHLFQGALTYRDRRFEGFDAATLIEVIEHIDLPRLDALKRVVFEFAKPKLVIITTPNVEYNVLFENLLHGDFRHNDHRFEWTRAEFESWARAIAQEYNYDVEFYPIGDSHIEHGSPTQMGLFLQKM